MSDAADTPSPYRVVYSERVRGHLVILVGAAKAHGKRQEVLEAIKEIDRRLHLYPQFGEPLRDLFLRPTRLWIGTVPPLVVQYALNEETRLVMVTSPLIFLPHSLEA